MNSRPVVFLDACVLFAPLVRRIVLGAAAAGLFTPLWSARVLDEWQIAVARRHGADAEDEVRAARSEMAGCFTAAEVTSDPELETSLRLPDAADVHVLAAAAGRAEILLTFNLRDFPRRTLAGLGLEARHPDGFLWELHSQEPATMTCVIAAAMAELDIPADQTRAVLRRARLARLGKAVASVDDPAE